MALVALGWLWWGAWVPFGAVVAAAVSVAGVALGDSDMHSAWQVSHLWHWAGSGGALGSRVALLSRAGCVAGVALGDIDLHFAWQVWHLATSTRILRGTYGTGWLWRRAWVQVGAVVATAVSVAGVALGDIDLHFVWQEWQLWDWAGPGGALGSRLAPLSRGCLRGRRGTW